MGLLTDIFGNIFSVYIFYFTIAGSLFYIFYHKLYNVYIRKVYYYNQDMCGKTILITGATSGIGKFTAFDLAKRNARVILACRDIEKAKEVAHEIRTATGNPHITVKYLDLTSFQSVRNCAKDILNSEDQLNILINNAGIGSFKGNSLTKDGYDIVMQTNYLGHFLLTLLLLKPLRKSSPSRIINVASKLHERGDMTHQNINLSNYNKSKDVERYGNTNIARILFSRELAERLLGTGITVNALHPGIVYTNIFRYFTLTIKMFGWIWSSLCGKSVEDGSLTTIRLAVDPDLIHTTGKYFANCQEAETTEVAKDTILARKLFEISEQAVGVTFSI